jgi:uncharacterized protein YkwD
MWDRIGKLAVVLMLIGGGAAGALFVTGAGPFDDAAATADAASNDQSISDGGSVSVATPSPTITATPTATVAPAESFAQSYDRDDLESLVTTEVDSLRQSANEDQLQWSEILQAPLRKHAQDMADDGYVSSTSPDGTSVDDRITMTCDPAVATAKISPGSARSAGGAASALVDRWAQNEQLRDRLTDGGGVKTMHAAGVAQSESGAVYVAYAAC